MKEITGLESLTPDLSVSLQSLLDKGIESYKEEINEISDFATKEQNLELVD